MSFEVLGGEVACCLTSDLAATERETGFHRKRSTVEVATIVAVAEGRRKRRRSRGSDSHGAAEATSFGPEVSFRVQLLAAAPKADGTSARQQQRRVPHKIYLKKKPLRGKESFETGCTKREERDPERRCDIPPTTIKEEQKNRTQQRKRTGLMRYLRIRLVFVHCEPRWYLHRVIALRMGGMQQYGISVSIFEQGNLQGNSRVDQVTLRGFVCLSFCFPQGHYRQSGSLFYI